MSPTSAATGAPSFRAAVAALLLGLGPLACATASVSATGDVPFMLNDDTQLLDASRAAVSARLGMIVIHSYEGCMLTNAFAGCETKRNERQGHTGRPSAVVNARIGTRSIGMFLGMFGVSSQADVAGDAISIAAPESDSP